MTTYDRVAHFIGLCCLGLLGLSANPDIYKHLPWWLIAAASVVGFAIQASTNPVMNKPTVGEAIEKAKIGIVLLFGLSLLGVSSCAHVRPIVSEIETCAGPACADIATKILPAVEVILECDAAAGFSPSALPACAMNGLDALAVAAGPDGWRIIGCITNALERDLAQPEGVRVRASAARKLAARRMAGTP